ncbi:UDP-glucose--hexose-1-phosphate uridylyltransferase [Alkalihalobacillus sp. AL-G]|uniref:UDP-glucose--hexose-1-phosphate uridylyltransferase n=1 Tax=Alkalihalobacillus sp. AL-G TaxID=2926399 RepID=UPI00272B04D8|nr:UDP-glucose--hexose-1-phosphate uridylyltransferase [Alkalihalobacillus sp. AL-G]WLD92790.1 UDP-glucose--hexose-1-phosphate uridylyltransferase [Alkalihalobacillus sp. AL-G]
MDESIYKHIELLLQYGLKNELIEPIDYQYKKNAILEVLEIDQWEEPEIECKELPDHPAELLEPILDWAASREMLFNDSVTFRDLFDTKIMACFVPRPSVVIRDFYQTYENDGPQKATKIFYEKSKKCHYIRMDRIRKNDDWKVNTDYGELEITINLSKPEKDPAAIATAKSQKESTYPKCLLCKENVGYAGRIDHPARQNHRTIPVQLTEEMWHLQFSPYVYYKEHAIIFKNEHEPMKISRKTFQRLLDFVERFPHYFIGSNADLPIVGGSILSHDHFQGGLHTFPMAEAKVEHAFELEEFPHVHAGIVKWPMSVIRIWGSDREQLISAADSILHTWKGYSDPNAQVYAFTNGEPHNTVTPIARRRGEEYELDIVLRNNITSEKHPLGIFHPHRKVHHIKKENIGLIEVMGLAVLPGRLKKEIELLGRYLMMEEPLDLIKNDETVAKHTEWAASIIDKYELLNGTNIKEVFQSEIGFIFSEILEYAGVFKRTPEGKHAFNRFIESIGTINKTN